MTTELPLYGAGPTARGQRRDLARGWTVLLFWGGPLAWMVAASVAGPTLRLSFEQSGLLLVSGTAWMGSLCLVNALRCGRSHCWIDGVLLPALAVTGALNLTRIVNFYWSTYVSAFWLILLASVIVECLAGSYPRARSSA
jgi:hypothetical protein